MVNEIIKNAQKTGMYTYNRARYNAIQVIHGAYAHGKSEPIWRNDTNDSSSTANNNSQPQATDFLCSCKKNTNEEECSYCEIQNLLGRISENYSISSRINKSSNTFAAKTEMGKSVTLSLAIELLRKQHYKIQLLDNQIKILNNNLLELREKNQQLEEENQQRQEENAMQQEENRQLRAENQELQEQLRAGNAMQQEENRKLRAENQELRAENQKLKERIVDNEILIESYRGDKLNLCTEIDALKKQIKELEQLRNTEKNKKPKPYMRQIPVLNNPAMQGNTIYPEPEEKQEPRNCSTAEIKDLDLWLKNNSGILSLNQKGKLLLYAIKAILSCSNYSSEEEEEKEKEKEIKKERIDALVKVFKGIQPEDLFTVLSNLWTNKYEYVLKKEYDSSPAKSGSEVVLEITEIVNNKNNNGNNPSNNKNKNNNGNKHCNVKLDDEGEKNSFVVEQIKKTVEEVMIRLAVNGGDLEKCATRGNHIKVTYTPKGKQRYIPNNDQKKFFEFTWFLCCILNYIKNLRENNNNTMSTNNETLVAFMKGCSPSKTPTDYTSSNYNERKNIPSFIIIPTKPSSYTIPRNKLSESFSASQP
jgi:FtsZ-binding cell division protein ZapB